MNIKAIADKIGIDYETVLEDFCGDVSELGSRLQRFAASDVITELKNALEAADHAHVKSLAHEARNKAEKVGLKNIAKVARRVEDADDDKIKNATIVLIEKLEDVFAAINKKEEE